MKYTCVNHSAIVWITLPSFSFNEKDGMLTKNLHAVIAITVLTELGQSIHITTLFQVEFRLPLLVKTSTAKEVVGNKYEHCTPVNGRIRVKE